ncbi:MAG: hypothetical protein HDQ88_07410 [Clostridia bacterium]|nr:hypothetical protein [Clostridia bacterium]
MSDVTFTDCIDYLKEHMDDVVNAINDRFASTKDSIRSSVLREIEYDRSLDMDLYCSDTGLEETVKSFFEQREGFGLDLDELLSELATEVVDHAIKDCLMKAFGGELDEDVWYAAVDDDVCYEIRAKSTAARFEDRGFVINEFLNIGDLTLEDVMCECEDD